MSSSSHAPSENTSTKDPSLAQAMRMPAGTSPLESERQQDWPSNPRNPMNWSTMRKYSLVVLISLTNVTASVCSTAFEPALPIMMRDFHSKSSSLSSLFITIYLLGYVLGPLLIAPCSELYGRTAVLRPAYVLFMVTLAVTASATNLAVFLVIRCLMGFAANAFVIVGPAIVADIIPPERRGLALSVLSSGPVLGPTLGPLLGGVIIQGPGWRWVFWTALIIFGALAVASIFILRETYPPLVQLQHQNPPASHHHSWLSVSFLSLIRSAPGKNPHQVLRAAFIRPPKLFFLAPIIPLLAVYGSISYSYLNVLFATLGTVFQERDHFSQSVSGVIYLGMTVGFAAALVSTGMFADRLTRRLAARRAARKTRADTEPFRGTDGNSDNNAAISSSDTSPLPEHRLPLAIAGSVLIIPSIFMYGFTADSSVHWIVPIIATSIIACSAVWTFMGVQMFLVDAYGTYAASATGAVSIFRSICAAVIPLAANPAYDRFGYGWGNAIFAFVCVPFVPVAIGLLIWGEKLRERFQVKL